MHYKVEHNIPQHSTAQHSAAQPSTAQPSPAQRSPAQPSPAQTAQRSMYLSTLETIMLNMTIPSGQRKLLYLKDVINCALSVLNHLRRQI